jgi:hypothetical protein
MGSTAMDDPQHLTDDEVDAFVGKRLGPEADEAAEVHVLLCPECQHRVSAVSDLVDGLERLQPRRPRTKILAQAAAVVLAALAGGVLGRNWRPAAPPDASPAPSLRAEPAAGWPTWQLRPVERGSTAQVFDMAGTGRFVVLEIDAAEMSGRARGLDVQVVDAEGRVVVQMTGLSASSDGVISLPLPARLLSEGSYVAETRRGRDVMRVPFSVRR